jgi:predicted transcriptional regulator
MTAITIEIANRETVNRRFKAAVDGHYEGEFLTFESLELLQKAISPRRWSLLQRLQAHGPMGVQALARELDLDTGNVQRDVTALKRLGLAEDHPDGGIWVPYDEIQMSAVLKRAA